MRSFSMTDKGIAREMNQDYVFSSLEPVGNLPNLFIVADGMGGHNAGDYASRCAVEIIVNEVTNSKESEPAAILRAAVEKANQEIVTRSNQDIYLLGMGTTVVIATILERQLWVANVGDSRLYIANEKMNQITRDHSLVEEMIRAGQLERSAARNHPDRNIITRAIGATNSIETDIFEMELEDKDQIILCSDGLTCMVEDDVILEVLNQSLTVEEKVKKLVAMANENGGRDNISVIIIDSLSGEVKAC